jgi:hypothetical protein
MNEPILCEVRCVYCDHIWTAFFPDGIEQDFIECPECHEDLGFVVP